MTLLLAFLLAAAPAVAEPSRAKGNLAALVSDSDYPADALRREEEGTVRFRLDVGPDGRVAGCTVFESSGSASLDSATCRIMRERARFVPARDSAGKNVSDTVVSTIAWRIEQAPMASPEIQAAFDAYLKCLAPRISPPLIDPLYPIADAAAPAFAACLAQENALLDLARGEADPVTDTEERAGLRRQTLAFFEEARRLLQR